MKVMFMLMSECAESLSGYFLKKEQEILDVDMEDIFTRFANDVIATTAFGIKTDSLEDQTNEFYVMGRAVLNFGSLRQRIKFFGYFFVPKLYSVSIHLFCLFIFIYTVSEIRVCIFFSRVISGKWEMF